MVLPFTTTDLLQGFCWVMAALLLVLALNFIANVFVFRRPRRKLLKDGEWPSVSVLIPARNEEHRLGPCLDSLLAQEYPGEIEWIVLDDHSTDGTAALVAAHQAGHPALRLVSGQDLPEGWTGKAWACAQLAREASGEWLLFTDADTRHAPRSVAAAVTEGVRRKAGLVSLWPRQQTDTLGEVLVIPFMLVLLLFFLPHWMPGRRRSLGAANGQFMLFRRDAYEAIGGHGAVQNHLVEDVALARAMKEAGLRPANLDGSSHVECRMYGSFREVWEGFTKNLRPGCEGSTLSFLVLLGVQAVALLGPFVLLPVLWGTNLSDWVVMPVLVIFWMRLLLAVKCKQSILSVLLHPLGQLAVLAIALNSWRAWAKGEVRWSGRVYGK